MQLYNTRTQKKEEFIPHEAGKVKMPNLFTSSLWIMAL